MFGIYDIFKWQGITSPDKTALICGSERYSYSQLNKRINCLARGLHEIGIGKGTPFGILLHNSVDFVAAFYAGIKLGACVNLFDYRWGTDELLQEIESVKCRHFILENSLLERVDALYPAPPSCIKIITVERSEYPSIEDFLGNGFDDWDYQAQLNGDDVIFTIFTGGTTGLPKASAHTQEGSLVRVIGLMSNSKLVNADDIYLNYAPMFHLGGMGAMLKVLSVGATFCLLSGFSCDEIVKTIEQERVTQFTLIPPTIIHRLQEAKDQGADFSSVRLLQLAGGSATDGTLELVFELFPDIVCVNAYGHSENALYMTNIFSKEQYYANRSIVRCIGKPEVYFEVKLVGENGEEVSQGQTGEAYGKSPAMLSGFVGQPAPFTEDGWYPTGDLMYQDAEGYFYFCSRSKDMIKSGGENVYAIEVECAITRENPDIAECAVVGLPDEEWGEIVVAAVVLCEGAAMTAEDVICHCKKYIASFKKPKKVFFLDQLPKSGIGKVKKDVLKQLLLDYTKQELY